jgi:1,4-alpha-glucan branching enzyme
MSINDTPPARTPPHSALSFVLHGHLPYARSQGRWPHGEEWIHEAASTTYMPLLMALNDLAARDVPFQLTIGLTPILMEQLGDETIRTNFEEYLADRLERAESDRIRFGKEGNAREGRVATRYAEFFGSTLDAFRSKFNRDIVGGFADLQRAGHVELMVSAATHGYLPLLGRASSIAAQLQVGIESYRRHTGMTPRAIWLPECAYRPAHNGLPGIEEFLEAQGLRLFFTEVEALHEAVLADGRPDMPTTFLPYQVASSSVSVVARNERVREQVWSRWEGYPGEKDYREFHRKDAESGLWYWRITGEGVELGEKDLYEPSWADQRVEQHARHFVGVVEDEMASWHRGDARPGIIAAAYDAELFGHWWFEGVQWLARVLELMAESPSVATASAGNFVAAHPPTEAIHLPPSSWGRYHNDFTWNNALTAWMWPIIHERERRMEGLVARYPSTTGITRDALNQAARELLLLEASDWPFLVTTGQAGEYATKRFNTHVRRFDRVTNHLINDTVETSAAQHLLRKLQMLDNPFPEIDYRVFQDRGPANAYLGPLGPGEPEVRVHPTSGQSWGEKPIGPGAPPPRTWGSDYLWHPSAAHFGHED